MTRKHRTKWDSVSKKFTIRSLFIVLLTIDPLDSLTVPDGMFSRNYSIFPVVHLFKCIFITL